MSSAARLSRSHHVTLHALEVLRLIGDRMEQKSAVDIEDVRCLFLYLNDVAHPCLNGSRPSHREVTTLFASLNEKIESENEEFVRLSRAYTDMLADLILLNGLDVPKTTGYTGHAEVFHRLELKYIRPHCI
jgi:hypothetical protein